MKISFGIHQLGSTYVIFLTFTSLLQIVLLSLELDNTGVKGLNSLLQVVWKKSRDVLLTAYGSQEVSLGILELFLAQGVLSFSLGQVSELSGLVSLGGDSEVASSACFNSSVESSGHHLLTANLLLILAGLLGVRLCLAIFLFLSTAFVILTSSFSKLTLVLFAFSTTLLLLLLKLTEFLFELLLLKDTALLVVEKLGGFLFLVTLLGSLESSKMSEELETNCITQRLRRLTIMAISASVISAGGFSSWTGARRSLTSGGATTSSVVSSLENNNFITSINLPSNSRLLSLLDWSFFGLLDLFLLYLLIRAEKVLYKSVELSLSVKEI